MDANELGRWTRFAAKGGIGKCVAVQDCVAEEEEDLMFLKDDEIIVLMQLPALEDVYLGYCEGVVGRFRGTDVRFHGRLKKPVMTKRSSRSLSRSSSRPSSSQSSAPALGHESFSALAHRDSPSLPSVQSRGSYSHSGASVLVTDTASGNTKRLSSNDPVTTNDLASHPLPPSPHLTTPSLVQSHTNHLRSVSHSSTSTAVDSSPRTPAEFQQQTSSLVRIVSISRQVDSPTEIEQDSASQDVSESCHEAEKSQATLQARNSAFLYRTGTPDGSELEPSFLDSEPSTRISMAISEGEPGIGLSLLQDFVNGDMDDAASVRSESIASEESEEDKPVSSPAPVSNVEANATSPITARSSRSSVYSHRSQISVPRAGSIVSGAVSVHSAPSRTSTHPSNTDSDYGGEEWEGASDIYDNYRYSRASMASKMSRLSKGSMYTVASGLGLEAPPPVPFDSRRPSLESLRQGPSVQQERLGSSATPSSAEDIARSGKPLESSKPTSPVTSNGEHKEIVSSTKRIPPPLNFGSHTRAAPSKAGSQPDSSPLLHTSFHSPLASPSLQSPTYLSPMSTPSTALLVSTAPGGAASSLRQRLEMERVSTIGTRQDEPSSAEEDHDRARLSTHPIVVEDSCATEISPAEPTPTSPSTSSLAFSEASEKRRMIETTYFVANQAPPPPYSPTATAFETPSSSRQAENLTIRQQETQTRHAFSRTSVFLPHPNAPKPAESSLGPMYGRVSMVIPPRLVQAAPSQTSALQAMHALLGILSRRDPMHPQRLTIYGKCARNLASSIGPVPVSFSLEPDAEVHTTKAQEGATVNDREASSPLHDAGGQPPISPVDFNPRSQASRPRSRSFSGFESMNSEANFTEEESTETSDVPSAVALARRSKSAHVHYQPQSPTNPRPPDSRSLHKPSPLAMNGTAPSSPTSSFRPPSSPLSQPPFNTPSSTSPGSPSVYIQESSSTHSSLGKMSSVLHSQFHPSISSTTDSGTQVTRSGSGSTAYSNTSPSSPVKADASNVLRHSRSSTFGYRPSGVRERSPSRSSIQGRKSGETDISHNDGRSMLTSPIPSSMSLRSKLSLPSLKIRAASDRFASNSIEERSPTLSVAPSEAPSEQPTVHIKDMDFELVNPTVQQLTIINEDPNASPLPSPNRPNPDNTLRAASPALSTQSGSSSRATLPTVISADISPSPDKPIDTGDVEAHRQRELRWISAMATTPAGQARKSKKIRKLLLEGVPASVRYIVWAHLTNSKGKRMDNLYPRLTMRDRVAVSASIERDIQRVFVDEPQLQDGSLMNILQAYLHMVPDTQYSRGLTVVAGRLLLQSPEEDAFWTFVCMVDTHLRPYFSPSSAQLDVDAAIFGKTVEAWDPTVAKKVFTDLDIPPISLCRPWFHAVFLEALPLEHAQRIWDLFLFDGITFLFRAGLAIVQCCKQSILMTSERDSILNMLLHPPSALLPASADAFLDIALNLKLKDSDIRKQRMKEEAKRQTQVRAQAIPGGPGLSISSPSIPLSTSNLSSRNVRLQ